MLELVVVAHEDFPKLYTYSLIPFYNKFLSITQ